MNSTTLPDRITAAEFASRSNRGKELVHGRFVELAPATVRSSMTTGEILGFLWEHLRVEDVGEVFGPGLGIHCFPRDQDHVRKPDICFVRRERLSHDILTAEFLSIAPDLVVEVVSPNDLAAEIDRKVDEYLAAGVRLVWVINPETRRGRVHRLDGSISSLREKDSLDGEDVLPGFRCPLADVLPKPVSV